MHIHFHYCCCCYKHHFWITGHFFGGFVMQLLPVKPGPTDTKLMKIITDMPFLHQRNYGSIFIYMTLKLNNWHLILDIFQLMHSTISSNAKFYQSRWRYVVKFLLVTCIASQLSQFARYHHRCTSIHCFTNISMAGNIPTFVCIETRKDSYITEEKLQSTGLLNSHNLFID